MENIVSSYKCSRFRSEPLHSIMNLISYISFSVSCPLCIEIYCFLYDLNPGSVVKSRFNTTNNSVNAFVENNNLQLLLRKHDFALLVES